MARIRMLDLRDLAKELAELKERIDDDDETIDDDDRERVKALEGIGRDLGYADGDFSGYAENEPTAIHEDDFAAYAEELAEEIGAIDRNASWPLTCIDWEKAGDELRADYSSFDLEGDTYLVRSV